MATSKPHPTDLHLIVGRLWEKQRASQTWRAVLAQAEHATQWLMPRLRGVFWVAGIGIAIVVFIGFLTSGEATWLWTKYSRQHAAIAPLLTLTAGLAVAGVALLRHFAQTDADRQRRITESFSKAIEQLGSEKLEVRLGGIYSLERISKESPSDYWTVMENLTAFVREHSHRTEAARNEGISQRAYFLWLEAGPEGNWNADFFWAKAVDEERPPTDIAAVLTVISRRGKRDRKRERDNDWRFDLVGAILRRAFLYNAHLERANLAQAHLEGAVLSGAHLEGAVLSGAHLEGASLYEAHLEEAFLYNAHLERANLYNAHLERANLIGAHLEGAFLVLAHLEGAVPSGARLDGATLDSAVLSGAHFEGANLTGAVGLSEACLMETFGDASTELPEGMARPPHWPNTVERAMLIRDLLTIASGQK